MKKALLAIASLFLLMVVGASGTGCSSRVETPVVEADSTLVYPPKDPDGVKASITFCERVSKRTGRRRGVGQDFTMAKKAKVRAVVDLENTTLQDDPILPFHIVWLRPDGKTIYKKRIEYTPGDSLTMLQSSLSIPPDRRDPGTYSLRVYLFRELIAEKFFRVHPPEA
jgi:hypothetical protein